MNCSTPGFPVLHCLCICSNSCLLSQRCHPTISSSVTPLLLRPQSFPASGSFPMSWLSHQVAKVLELQHQSSHKYSGFISFRIDWFDLLAALRLLGQRGLGHPPRFSPLRSARGPCVKSLYLFGPLYLNVRLEVWPGGSFRFF